jgi:hypothetical protein
MISKKFYTDFNKFIGIMEDVYKLKDLYNDKERAFKKRFFDAKHSTREDKYIMKLIRLDEEYYDNLNTKSLEGDQKNDELVTHLLQVIKQLRDEISNEFNTIQSKSLHID